MANIHAMEAPLLGYAVLEPGQKEQPFISADPPAPPPGRRTVAILGGGLGGLTTAYELAKKGYDCTVLEAHPRVGGRCLTLRSGDKVVEEGHGEQVCSFEPHADGQQGDCPPYFNAGPGRIPSAHIHLLSYLKEFGVKLELYAMTSGANRTFIEGAFGGSVANRQLDHDTRGRLAALLYRLSDNHLTMSDLDAETPEVFKARRERLKELLVPFGYLVREARSGVRVGDFIGSSRSGYKQLPATSERPPWVEPLKLGALLDSEFWKHRFYQPQDFLWQPTLMQPVGGMDKVVDAFLERATGAGAKIKTNAIVKKVRFDTLQRRYVIEYSSGGNTQTMTADYCLSNIPLPLLDRILDTNHFSKKFRDALHAVYKAKYITTGNEKYPDRFLAATTKVGWQAPQDGWSRLTKAGTESGSEEVVPIFGGISWSSTSLTQMWYPSSEFFKQSGILTGAYNYDDNAVNWGKMKPQERLARARREAAPLFKDKAFVNEFRHGITIAWQNIPHIKGGWAQWLALERVKPDTPVTGPTFSAECYNTLLKGDEGFHIVGDQMSVLPGWQEGAVVSALYAINRLGLHDQPSMRYLSLPDSRVLVEGYGATS